MGENQTNWAVRRDLDGVFWVSELESGRRYGPHQTPLLALQDAQERSNREQRALEGFRTALASVVLHPELID